MKKVLFLFIMLVSISMYCEAQNYTEVVYLKNGSVISGTIVERTPNLIVKTKDGSLIVCKTEDVDRITKEETYVKDDHKDYSNYKLPGKTLKGYKGFIDFGYLFDISDNNASIVELSTSHGYQFNNYIFLGGGIALDYYADAEQFAIPIFANFRANFNKKKITPFADVKAGYSVGDVEGAQVSMGMGVRFSLKKRKAVNLTLLYNLQEYEDSYWGDVYNLESIGLKFGFEF